MTDFQRDPASFRDPDGWVLHSGDRVLRALTERGATGWRAAKDCGAIDTLVERKLLIPTRVLDETDPVTVDVKRAHPEIALLLEHDRIDLITWPSEWTVAMLADAGLHTLEVQKCLLEKRLSLKDATAFNIAFVNGRPIFLDVSSIESPSKLNVWYALGQFQRMFLYPLLLARKGRLPADIFTTHLDGITPRETADALGRLGWLHPGRLLQVYLPAWLEGQSSGGSTQPARTPTGNPEVQRTILNANARRLRRLRAKCRPRGIWVDYRDDNSYSNTEEKAKADFVRAFAQTHNPQVCIDFGANTGVYSRLLAELCDQVIAVEGDHGALDAFYRESSGISNIQYLRSNIANPTPGTGFMNVERPALMDRLKGDAVFALALVHHLLVSAGLSLDQVARLLTHFAPRLVVEYVAPTDPMFRRLVEGREDLWGGLTEEIFANAFLQHGFRVVDRLELKAGERVLLAMKLANA